MNPKPVPGLIAHLTALSRLKPVRHFMPPPDAAADPDRVFPVNEGLLKHAEDNDSNGLVHLHELVMTTPDPNDLPADRETLINAIPTTEVPYLNTVLQGLPDFSLRVLADTSVCARVDTPDGQAVLWWPRHYIDFTDAAGPDEAVALYHPIDNAAASTTWEAVSTGPEIDVHHGQDYPGPLLVDLWHLLVDKLANHLYLGGHLNDRTPPPHTLRRYPVIERQQALELLPADAHAFTALVRHIPDFQLDLDPEQGRLRLIVDSEDDDSLLFDRPLLFPADVFVFLWDTDELRALASATGPDAAYDRHRRQTLRLPWQT